MHGLITNSLGYVLITMPSILYYYESAIDGLCVGLGVPTYRDI